ncbi:MAG: hypothetical protein ACYDEN_11365 [Acidimicrobiales bacterium]
MTTPRKTVSVSGRTHLQLRLLAATTGRPAGELVAEAVEAHYRPAINTTRAYVAATIAPPAGEPETPAAAAVPPKRQRRARQVPSVPA